MSSSELQAKDASRGCFGCLRDHWLERLGDVQRSGVWPPEKCSQIGNNVSFKHRQKQILSSHLHFVIGPSAQVL